MYKFKNETESTTYTFNPARKTLVEKEDHYPSEKYILETAEDMKIFITEYESDLKYYHDRSMNEQEKEFFNNCLAAYEVVR